MLPKVANPVPWINTTVDAYTASPYAEAVDYEWDPDKDAANLRKHGLRLPDGVDALEDPSAFSWIDDRYDYGEEREITLGMSPSGILYVVTTEIKYVLTRIISVRRAKRNEQQKYDQNHP